MIQFLKNNQITSKYRNMLTRIIFSAVFGLMAISSCFSQVTAPTNTTGDVNSERNWVIEKTFDENGNVITEEKRFFDNGGQLLQSQNKMKYRKDPSTVYTHVFASQFIKDANGRAVLNTLSAPIDYSEFIYKPDFVRNTGGTTYDYRHFDLFDPTGSSESNLINTPQAVGGQSVKGTLGWYFGPNNNWEPYVPTTDFPYSRKTHYKDGTGEKKMAGIGETFKMGTGREVGAFVTPVSNELWHYLEIRNSYFTTAELGGIITTLKEGTTQEITRDVNGRETILIKDRSGKTLMTARPGNTLQTTNTVTINAEGKYNAVVNSANLVVGSSAGDIVIDVYAGGNLIYHGPESQFSTSGAPPQIEIRSDQRFGYIHCTDPPFNSQCTDPTEATGGPQQVYYFKVFADNSDVTITGSYTLYDMSTETTTSLLSGNKLNKGYYKLVANSGNVTLTYVNGYSDISYNFYNQLGQLIANVAPEGVSRLLNPNSSANCYFNNQPVFEAIPDFAMQYGTQRTISVHATDIDNNTLTISFDNLPAFASTTNITNGQTNVTFNPTSSGNQGTYIITAKVSDGIGILVTKNFKVIVNAGANLPPVIPPIADYYMRTGHSLTVPIIATDPDGDILTFSSPNLPYFATLVNLGNGRCNLLLEPPLGEQGGYSIRINVTDEHSALSFDVFSTIIADNGAPVVGAISDKYMTEAQSSSIIITATDDNGLYQLMQYTAYGLPSFATLTYNGGGQATIQLSPGITSAGVYPVTINVNDGFGANTSKSFVIQVCDNTTIIPDKTKMPFATLNEYDVQGRLIKTTTTDGGTIELVYRRDGKLRFSQDAAQKLTGRYSYTNFDAIGRSVETGEYQPDGSGIAFTSDMSVSSPLKNILENTSATGGLTTGTKTDVITKLYDVSDNSHGQSGYTQDAAYLSGRVSMTRRYSSVVNNTPNSADIISGTWYSYDEEGKLTWSIEYINGLGYKTTDIAYDALSRPIKKVYQKNTAAETFVHYYEFDASTHQLYKVYTNTTDNFGTKQLLVTYKYYLNGALKRKELAGNLQGIDYAYTINGDLKSVNNSDKTQDIGGDGPGNGFGTDAFGMVLDYFPGDYLNTRTGIQTIKGVNTSGIGTESYDGNLKAMTWYSRKPVSTPGMPGVEDPTAYVFNYDDKYQFTESTWGTGINFTNTPASFTSTQFNKESIKNPVTSAPGYDANGNIQFLQRTNTSGQLTDRFAYNYYLNTNKLQSVINDATLLPETHATYVYDKRGQVVLENTGNPDFRKFIRYDGAGQVMAVARDAGFTQKIVEFEYNEVGKRVKKKIYNGSYQLSEVAYYTGDAVYTQPVTNGGTTFGTITAQEFKLQGDNSERVGLFYRPSSVYAFELSDHLGNVRAIIAQSVGGYEVRLYSDYYPFGKVIQKGGIDNYRFGFQGQFAEKDPETDWNAFTMRMYDSRIGRWMSIDPANQFSSPYVGMGNSPQNGVDKDGAIFGTIIGGILGGLIEGTVTAINGGDFWEGAKRGAVRGAIAGAVFDLAAATGGVSLLATGAMAGMISEQADQTFFGDGKVHVDRLAFAAVTGGVGGVFLNRVSFAIARSLSGKMWLPIIETPPLQVAGPMGEVPPPDWKFHSVIDDAAVNAGKGETINLTTSSTSTALSRTYTIYEYNGSLYKFGVTDANLIRFNQSLKEAGQGAYGNYSDIVMKYQAHLHEKYLRSLHYSSTGIWTLRGQKYPYPVDFSTGKRIPRPK
jgi:RHS repeat-associated protein